MYYFQEFENKRHIFNGRILTTNRKVAAKQSINITAAAQVSATALL